MKKGFGLWLLIFAGGVCAQELRPATSLSIATWGGVYADVLQQQLFMPFSEQSRYAFVVKDNAAVIEALAAGDELHADLINLDADHAARACAQGTLVTLGSTELALIQGAAEQSSADDLLPDSLTTCALGSGVMSTVIGVDVSQYSEQTPPTRLADFFAPDVFPGKRGLYKNPRGLLEWALLADGVAAEQVYAQLQTAAGRQRAFRMLDNIKADIVWLDDVQTPQQLLREHRVVMTQAHHDVLGFDLLSGQLPQVAVIWDGQIWRMNYWAIPQASSNQAAALEFLAFVHDKARQAALARYALAGPTRATALTLLNESQRQYLPSTAEHLATALAFDAVWWRAQASVLEQQFRQWLVCAYAPCGSAITP